MVIICSLPALIRSSASRWTTCVTVTTTARITLTSTWRAAACPPSVYLGKQPALMAAAFTPRLYAIGLMTVWITAMSLPAAVSCPPTCIPCMSTFGRIRSYP